MYPWGKHLSGWRDKCYSGTIPWSFVLTLSCHFSFQAAWKLTGSWNSEYKPVTKCLLYRSGPPEWQHSFIGTCLMVNIPCSKKWINGKERNSRYLNERVGWDDHAGKRKHCLPDRGKHHRGWRLGAGDLNIWMLDETSRRRNNEPHCNLCFLLLLFQILQKIVSEICDTLSLPEAMCVSLKSVWRLQYRLKAQTILTVVFHT